MVHNRKDIFGDIVVRPVDRRENYVKRCVGLPGQTLQIKDQKVYVNGKMNKEPDNVQYTYFVRFKQALPDATLEQLEITIEDSHSSAMCCVSAT